MKIFDWEKWNNCWSWILLVFPLSLYLCISWRSISWVCIFCDFLWNQSLDAWGHLSKESQTNQLVTHLLLALLIDWEVSLCLYTFLFRLCICLSVFVFVFFVFVLLFRDQTNQLVTQLLLALLIDWEFSVCVCTCLFFLCICLCICPFCLCISLSDQTNR